jgi:hypothetical protein
MATVDEFQPRPTMPVDPEIQRQRDADLAQQNLAEIQAELHNVWLRQLQQRRGILFRVTAADWMILEALRATLDKIPTTEQ